VIVVDANILAYLYLPGPLTARAEALFAKDPDWAAPLLWRSEFRNILLGYLRRELLSLEEAAGRQRQAEELLAGAEFQVESREVLALARHSCCTAYDCEYVALAVHLDTRLVTMDKQLIRQFPKRVVALASAVE
jgi:predicted nucleic acid-binding protein